eukprot:GHVS01022840.1.p1 GENE.GHVS01022840.1~~GHVS01022840.1.p1  ORF type:complete len:471 (-),score=70.22 GHVS01022840.1:819-2231(-)
MTAGDTPADPVVNGTASVDGIFSNSWFAPTATGQVVDPWVIGVLASLLGSFCGSLGDNMVRKGFLIAGEDVNLMKMWRSPMWTIGMFFSVIVNTVCTLVALAFAPATIVTSFAGVHILWNMLIAKTWNRERTTGWDYVGSGCIILGIVLIVVYSGKEHHIGTVDGFWAHMVTPYPMAFMLAVFALLLTCWVLSFDWVCERIVNEAHVKGIQRFAISTMAGVCGGMSNVLAKAVVLTGTAVQLIGFHAVAKDPATYAVVGLTVIFAVSQLVFLNTSLKRFEAIYVVPIINSLLIACGSFGGLVLFNEIPSRYDLYIAGMCLVCAGAAFLSYGKYEAEVALLQKGLLNLPSTVSLDALQRHAGEEEAAPPSCCQCFDYICKPLTDVSVDILTRTNTLSIDYPSSLLQQQSIRSRPSFTALEERSYSFGSGTELNKRRVGSLPAVEEEAEKDFSDVCSSVAASSTLEPLIRGS